MTPSPSPRLVSVKPTAQREPSSHVAMRAGHPCIAPYDHEREREVTVLLAFSLGDAGSGWVAP